MQINDLNEFEIAKSSRKLGEGTFSEVYKVRNIKNGKFYALKEVV